MKRNAMSLKAIINNIAKENKVSAQSVLQTYMLERLLERISISKYKDNFILKGGMLISAMLGIDSRTTMDMDTTIKGFKLTEENIKKIINEICNIKIDDGVTLVWGEPKILDIFWLGIRQLRNGLCIAQGSFLLFYSLFFYYYRWYSVSFRFKTLLEMAK